MEDSHGAARETGRVLTDWYYQNCRDLPWRHTRDPYAIWVSEIMLQQTRVDTVIGYYDRFLAAFPTVEALAAAPRERVLKAWEGLGYYSRAANLHKGAAYVCERLGGRLPADRAALLKIPGIGRYTSGSIASIAFNLPEPAVDGNVLRVIARLLDIREPVEQPAVRDRIEQTVGEMIPEGESVYFCQALMELGALVCVPGEPACMPCPLRTLCRAFEAGVQGELPVRTLRKPPVEQPRIVAVIRCGDLFRIRRRGDEGLLAGLWEFYGWEQPDEGNDPEIIGRQLRQWGMEPAGMERIGDSRHVFTHRVWLMRGWSVQVARQTEPSPEERWVTARELRDYPFPSAMRYFLRWAEHIPAQNRP